MFKLTIYDSSEDKYLSFPRLVSVVVLADHTLCFSYIDALGCIITDTFKLENLDAFKISLL